MCGQLHGGASQPACQRQDGERGADETSRKCAGAKYSRTIDRGTNSSNQLIMVELLVCRWSLSRGTGYAFTVSRSAGYIAYSK
jgi:hypothetical protein